MAQMEKSKSTNKLTALFGREPATIKEQQAAAAAQSRATGITSRAKEPIKGWVRKLGGEGHLPVVASLAQKVYLKMQASWEGEGSIVKYYSEQSCTATSYKGTIRLKTVTSIVVDKENGNRFHIETPKKVYHFEAVPSTTNPQHCPTRAAWIQMWADNTNFEEARRNIAALKSIAEGNHENSAGITRPTAEQLAMPRLKHTKKNPALETGTGTQPTGPGAAGSGSAPLLTRDVEEKMSNYEKQIADLQRQLKQALTGANGAASPRKNPVSPPLSDEDRVKSERLAVLLEMGVVSKAEYEEKMSALSPRGGSPVGSGAASPRNGPKRGRSAKNKNDTKVAKLNELLSMEVITQEEYDDRLAKIQSQG